MIREIEGPNLDRDLRQYQHDEKFVAYEPGGYVSEPMEFGDAVRVAAGRGGDATVGFLTDEPIAQAAPAAAPKRGRKRQ